MKHRARGMPQASDRATQDMQVLQILTEAHRMAEDRREDAPVWAGLADRTRRFLDAMGAPARGDPVDIGPSRMDRMDRTAIGMDAETADRLAASLMALASQPDEERARLADDCLREIEEHPS